jgi:hypothetical protein
MKGHDPLPHQRGDHDQPHARAFDRRVLRSGTDEQCDPTSKSSVENPKYAATTRR